MAICCQAEESRCRGVRRLGRKKRRASCTARPCPAAAAAAAVQSAVQDVAAAAPRMLWRIGQATASSVPAAAATAATATATEIPGHPPAARRCAVPSNRIEGTQIARLLSWPHQPRAHARSGDCLRGSRVPSCAAWRFVAWVQERSKISC